MVSFLFIKPNSGIQLNWLINSFSNLAAKVISNRPVVSGTTPMSNIPDVGVYGSNPNLANNGSKINVDSKY